MLFQKKLALLLKLLPSLFVLAALHSTDDSKSNVEGKKKAKKSEREPLDPQLGFSAVAQPVVLAEKDRSEMQKELTSNLDHCLNPTFKQVEVSG